MRRKALVSVIFFTLAAIVLSEISYAQVGVAVMGARRVKKRMEQKQQAADIVDVGNKTCPVLGGNVDGKDFYVYNGKRYGLCCPMCKATFANDPEKYAAIADKEIKAK